MKRMNAYFYGGGSEDETLIYLERILMNTGEFGRLIGQQTSSGYFSTKKRANTKINDAGSILTII